MGSWIMKKHILVIVCLLLITPLLCIYTSSISERIIAHVYQSITRSRLVVTLDDDGVPINDYQYFELGSIYVGKQRNPVTIAQRALVCWDKYDVYLPHYYPFEDKNKGYD